MDSRTFSNCFLLGPFTAITIQKSKAPIFCDWIAACNTSSGSKTACLDIGEEKWTDWEQKEQSSEQSPVLALIIDLRKTPSPLYLTVTLDYKGPLKAPIEEGTQVANLIISKKDEIIKKLPLYAAEDLKKVNFFKSLLTSLNYLIWGDV